MAVSQVSDGTAGARGAMSQPLDLPSDPRQRRIALEVFPHLVRTSAGLLAENPKAGMLPLSTAGQTLLSASVREVNKLVLSGKVAIQPDLSLRSLSMNALGGGSNWWHWHWYGYDAGIDDWHVQRFCLIGPSDYNDIAGALVGVGWAASAAWPVALYFCIYNAYMTWKDHGRGETFTATWGNLWCPVVNSQ